MSIELNNKLLDLSFAAIFVTNEKGEVGIPSSFSQSDIQNIAKRTGGEFKSVDGKQVIKEDGQVRSIVSVDAE